MVWARAIRPVLVDPDELVWVKDLSGQGNCIGSRRGSEQYHPMNSLIAC